MDFILNLYGKNANVMDKTSSEVSGDLRHYFCMENIHVVDFILLIYYQL